jgi:nucleolar protein 14
MGNFKDKNKKKIKRKKGKKFVYKNNSVLNKKEEKINPFEAVSNKKFMKHGKKYDNLINEYDSRYNTNSFIDNRIGEKSKSLSYDDKMKLRFKAQQLINMKNKKNKFSIMNEEGDEDLLTHKGKNLNELNLIDDDDNDKSEDEFYENMDNYMEEMDKNKGKLSRKEIIQNIIAKSKAFKEEKQRMKQSNIEKIQLLDETFSEISSLLKKRARSYSKYNDDYDRFAGSFLNTQNKTHPTVIFLI